MSFTSFGFLLLTALCVTVYYIIPHHFRRIWLLAVSCFYYMVSGPFLILYLVFAAFITWSGARLLTQKGSASREKARTVLIISLILDFSVLAVLKYTGFAAAAFKGITGIHLPVHSFLLPLGISFYTFQSAGYLIDVSRGWCEPEPDFGKYLLFVAFFPQLMQGPIGRYKTLGPQLSGAQHFNPENIRLGLWRIVWGIFKKTMVADNAAVYVDAIFNNWQSLPGFGLQGVLMYSIQLYADFSGGIDIALGIARMMGITLDENFRQPYFARSLTDFWHRWHITLGNWMKDYLFYPISLSGWMKRLQKRLKGVFGKSAGRAMSVGIANIIVFLVVGIWHGPAWHFIFFGLYHGVVIALSGLLTKPFLQLKKRFGIRDDMRWFGAFQILRTFVVVNISWFLDRADTLRQAWQMFLGIFRGPLFSVTVADPANPGKCLLYFTSALFGLFLILIVSILKEKGKDVSGMAAALPLPVRICVLTGLLLICALLGNRLEGGFIYANF